MKPPPPPIKIAIWTFNLGYIKCSTEYFSFFFLLYDSKDPPPSKCYSKTKPTEFPFTVFRKEYT